MPFVQSVNLGSARRAGAKFGVTGIDKRPVGGPVLVRAPGPKGVGGSGLAGDRVCDLNHHGGDDQAVYAYAREDLDAWQADLGFRLRSGSFGENLTTAGLDVTSALIGERWRIGEQAVLQVTVPRIPCRTFAAWMDVRGWVKTFTQRGMPGAYLRVVRPGWIQAGDPLLVEHRPEHRVTVGLVFQALTIRPELLPRLLDATDLPAEARDKARKAAARAQ
jgi:MOSC domain-containing protein YiiM